MSSYVASSLLDLADYLTGQNWFDKTWLIFEEKKNL
jgi:hypothetical protein